MPVVNDFKIDSDKYIPKVEVVSNLVNPSNWMNGVWFCDYGASPRQRNSADYHAIKIPVKKVYLIHQMDIVIQTLHFLMLTIRKCQGLN